MTESGSTGERTGARRVRAGAGPTPAADKPVGKAARSATRAATREATREATRRTGGRRSAAGVGEVDVPERGPGGRWPVPERSLLATVLGVPPLVAVLVAAAATALGVVVDLLRIGTLGTPFTILYLSGCVLAVAWVRRRGLFGPMVQPPLLLAVAVPVVVLLAGSPRPGTGISERLLTIGAPLVNSFPIMAWTTAAVIALGTGRLLVQREAVEAARPAGGRRAVSGRSGRGAARGAARRSASPPPS